jgi:hypothetical protein
MIVVEGSWPCGLGLAQALAHWVATNAPRCQAPGMIVVRLGQEKSPEGLGLCGLLLVFHQLVGQVKRHASG